MPLNANSNYDPGDTPSDAITLWDTRYASRRGYDISIDSDPWLERWCNILVTARDGKTLELGCGGGRDSRFLTELGLDLIAGDNSPAALSICRQHAPRADVRLLDIREPLPFEQGLFTVIVASLCLHYFPWHLTMAIMSGINRCLKTGGFLLVRVNSTGDIHYGAAGYLELEPGLYNVNGELKRFFDRKSVESLIGGGDWKIHSLEELTINRYNAPKIVWELVLEKQVKG